MTTRSVSIEPVVKIVRVACSPEEAFRYFTVDLSIWLPVATHYVVAYESEFNDNPAAVIFEPRVGGRILERTSSGEEHLWGTVLTWEPPTLVVFSFHPGRTEKEAQRVEVRFSPAAEGARVVLTHSGWDKLTAKAQKSRDSYNQGWETVFVAAYPEYVHSRK